MAVGLVRRGSGDLVRLERRVHEDDHDPVRHGFWQIFEHWEPYGIVVAGLPGSCSHQDAFQPGPITASQATLTIVDPIVSIVIGVGLFDDEFRGGKGAWLRRRGPLVMCAGLFVLTQSPLIAGSVAHEQPRATSPATRPPKRYGRRPEATGSLVTVATYLDRVRGVAFVKQRGPTGANDRAVGRGRSAAFDRGTHRVRSGPPWVRGPGGEEIALVAEIKRRSPSKGDLTADCGSRPR